MFFTGAAAQGNLDIQVARIEEQLRDMQRRGREWNMELRDQEKDIKSLTNLINENSRILGILMDNKENSELWFRGIAVGIVTVIVSNLVAFALLYKSGRNRR